MNFQLIWLNFWTLPWVSNIVFHVIRIILKLNKFFFYLISLLCEHRGGLAIVAMRQLPRGFCQKRLGGPWNHFDEDNTDSMIMKNFTTIDQITEKNLHESNK
jgi:hypothetical protein